MSTAVRSREEEAALRPAGRRAGYPRAAALALVLAAALALPAAAPAAELRRNRLPAAWQEPRVLRSVLFIRGMTCRACTMLLDRRLDATLGVRWARFNFPLRLLVIYHDPVAAPLDTIRALVDGLGELRAETLESRPAPEFKPVKGVPIAAWQGGALDAAQAAAAVSRFGPSLRRVDVEEGSEEWDQFSFEIVGEEVRTRILLARAAAAGFRTGPPGTTLPTVIPREFYWPSKSLDPTPEEAGLSRFLREKVLLGDEGDEGRARFDTWLLGLWREIGLDFRGEAREAAP